MLRLSCICTQGLSLLGACSCSLKQLLLVPLCGLSGHVLHVVVLKQTACVIGADCW